MRLRVVPRSVQALVAAGALALAAPIQSAAPATPRVRFHHFHFRVPDPAAAMNHGATTLGGSRVLLRGLGVGIRVGTAYALFDRLEASDPSGTGTVTQSSDGAYGAARQWLNARGVEVDSDASDIRVQLANLFGSEVLDHVGFTTADTSGVAAALRAHHAQAVKQTDNSRLYRVVNGGGVEIVRDLDAPDAFWCPMHPDMRSPAAGKCPLCGMALVPIPPPRVGEYRMDVSLKPVARGRGASGLRLTIRDPETGAAVGAFATIHERLLHLFVIDRTLEYFRHVHPITVRDGTFDVALEIPPGEYAVIADFLPLGGRAQMLQRAIVTPGYRGPLFRSTELTPEASLEKVEGETRVTLEASGVRPGKEAVLKFALADAASGEPVSDLEPFLGAPGHMLIVSADLTVADHVHPEEPATRGPVITFQPLLSDAGSYKLWLQFQRHGAVVTVPFVLTVESR